MMLMLFLLPFGTFLTSMIRFKLGAKHVLVAVFCCGLRTIFGVGQMIVPCFSFSISHYSRKTKAIRQNDWKMKRMIFLSEIQINGKTTEEGETTSQTNHFTETENYQVKVKTSLIQIVLQLANDSIYTFLMNESSDRR